MCIRIFLFFRPVVFILSRVFVCVISTCPKFIYTCTCIVKCAPIYNFTETLHYCRLTSVTRKRWPDPKRVRRGLHRRRQMGNERTSAGFKHRWSLAAGTYCFKQTYIETELRWLIERSYYMYDKNVHNIIRIYSFWTWLNCLCICY